MANEKNESKELQELRAQLEAQQKQFAAATAETADLKAHAADLKSQLDAARARGGGPEKTTASIMSEGKYEPVKNLPDKYRGAKQYRVGLQGGYYRGRLLSAGDIVTLIDDVPSRTWTLVERVDRAPSGVAAEKPSTAPAL